MSEKTNFKKLDYQERVLNSNEKFICEDWERGTGKTTTLLRKVLKPNTSVLWVTNAETQFNMLINKLRNELKLNYEFDTSISKRKMIIHLEDGDCILHNYIYNGGDVDINCCGLKVDNVVIDDVNVKFDLNFKNQLDDIIKPMMKENSQIIHLYTSIKNHFKSNKEYYKSLERKVIYKDRPGLCPILDLELSKIIKPNARILVVGNDKKDFNYIMSCIDNKNLKLFSNYQAKYYLSDDTFVPITFITLNDFPMIGKRVTDIFTIDIDINNEKNKEILDCCIYPFLIPHIDTDQWTITHINKEEEKTDRYKILDNQIDILLKELDGTQKSSNTTMTREKIIGMIDRLYKIKELEK